MKNFFKKINIFFLNLYLKTTGSDLASYERRRIIFDLKTTPLQLVIFLILGTIMIFYKYNENTISFSGKFIVVSTIVIVFLILFFFFVYFDRKFFIEVFKNNPRKIFYKSIWYVLSIFIFVYFVFRLLILIKAFK